MNASSSVPPGDAYPIAAPRIQWAVLARGITGGIVGGIAGYFIFRWLTKQGMYGMMIPGALIGLGAGLTARGRSVTLGVICAIAALALSLYAEWWLFPFMKDNSLTYFLTHLHQLRPLTLIMMGVGVAFAYWLGQGR